MGADEALTDAYKRKNVDKLKEEVAWLTQLYTCCEPDSVSYIWEDTISVLEGYPEILATLKQQIYLKIASLKKQIGELEHGE